MNSSMEIEFQYAMDSINIIETIIELEALIAENRSIYFYGACKIGSKILEYLKERGMIECVKDIFVTKESIIPIKKYGILIHEFNLSRYETQIPIVIAAKSCLVQKEICEILRNNSVKKINIIGKNFEKSIDSIFKGLKYSKVKEKIQKYVGYKNTSKIKQDICFFSPPYWDSYSPFSAVPSLVAHLQRAGYKAGQIDLGILCTQWMIKYHWQEIAALCISEKYYEEKIKDYKKNAYRCYEEFRDDMWFFQGTHFNVKLVKDSYLSMNSVQKRIIDAFYMELYNFDISYFDFEACKGLFGLVDDYILSNFLTEISSDEIISIFQNLPSIIGLSITSTAQFLPACLFSKIIKEIYPNTVVIMGGSCAELFIKCQYKEKSEIYQYFDYIIVGEGETALKMLLDYLIKEKGDYKEIPNLLHIDDKGNVSFTSQIVENVNTLSMPCYDGLDLNLYLSPQIILPYQSSRGCHYGHCSFCNHDEKYRHNYRSKDMKKVVEELIDLSKQYSVSNFQFVDEAIRPDCFQELVNTMDKYEEFKSINWFFYSRVSRQYNEDLLEKASKNGCKMVMFGVESFNQRLLKFIRKGISAETSKYCLRLFHKCGIKTYAWLMCNLPSETLEEAREDLETVKKMEEYIDAFSVGPFFLSKNTDMYREPHKFNIISLNELDPYRFTSHYEGKIIDKDEMLLFYKQEYSKYQMDSFSVGNRYTLFMESLM